MEKNGIAVTYMWFPYNLILQQNPCLWSCSFVCSAVRN